MADNFTNTIYFNVNGRDVELINPDPERSLASYLRNDLGLTGTKIGCEEGACGSCTVVIGKWDEASKNAHYSAVNACLYPLFLADNCLILTVEGIGNPKKMHPIQERLAKGHGTQCGFCSPGFIMSAYALFRNNPNPSKFDIDMAIKGNYCRCTGYRPIIEAFYSFTEAGGCCRGKENGGCPCKTNNGNTNNTQNGDLSKDSRIVSLHSLPNIDPTQELIFPPSLMLRPPVKSLHIAGPRVELYAPITQEEASHLSGNENTKVISSGMLTRLNTFINPSLKETWLSIHQIVEFSTYKLSDDCLIIGASMPIARMMNLINAHCEEAISKPILNLYANYSSLQVSNLATWTGAICQTEKLNDTQTICLALNTEVEIRDSTGNEMQLSMDKFVDILPKLTSNGAYVISMSIPRKLQGKMFTLKHGARIGGDEPIVNFAAVLEESKDGQVEHARIAFGLEKKPFLATNVSNFIVGKKRSSSLENELKPLIKKDLEIYSSIKDFDYKQQICIAALAKMLNNEEQEKWRYEFSSSQIFKDTSKPNDSCGRPLAVQYADRSVTGDAVYVGDMKVANAAHLAFVTSKIAHGVIIAVDTSEAKQIPGFIAYVDAKDIPANGTNQPGLLDTNMMVDNTPLFASGKVESIGQVIGAIVAEDALTARRAAQMIKIAYEPLDAIISLKDAVSKDSTLCEPFEMGTPIGHVENVLKESETVLEGEISGGGQEHLYMEPMSSIAVPKESDEWIIYSATQASCMLQHQVAAVLGIPAHKVVVKVKRVGGAFGGKASQANYLAIMTAVAARKVKRPVSMVLSRHDDILMTGKRHPFYSKYRIGLDKDKKIQVVDFNTYFNGGWSLDVSKEVNMVYVMRSNQSFKFPNLHVQGQQMKTNTNSNTAFRGFGQPQAHFLIEYMLLQVAHELGREFEELCYEYFADIGDKCTSGHTIRNDMLKSCWNTCKTMSEFEKRKKEIQYFNSTSKQKKRGIAMTSTRFGMTHWGALEQGIALVQIYLDGSVEVSHGGTEMGQGLNQKCIQVASRALGISADRITILESSTDKTANSPETGGSIGADLHGQAVKNACEEIMARFQPLIKKYGSWDKAASKAFLDDKVSLRAVGYGIIDREKYKLGMEESYYTTGVACSEVEIDTTTGEHKVLRVDICMDLGDSLNPAIDIGQIEGAFMQGYGYLTTEELTFDERGILQQGSAYGYKIPTVPMTPAKFNVKLLEKGMNFPQQVYGSKGVGEPPLLLGFSVYTALHKAIMNRRQELGRTEWVQIDAPLTAKRIVEFCNP